MHTTPARVSTLWQSCEFEVYVQIVQLRTAAALLHLMEPFRFLYIYIYTKDTNSATYIYMYGRVNPRSLQLISHPVTYTCGEIQCIYIHEPHWLHRFPQTLVRKGLCIQPLNGNISPIREHHGQT